MRGLVCGEIADIKVDFKERCDRIRATIEVHGTVSIECTKETFREWGGVEGMTEILVKNPDLGMS